MFITILVSFLTGCILGGISSAWLSHRGNIGRIVIGFIIRWCTLLLLLTVLYRTLSLDLVIVLVGFFFALWTIILRRLRGFS